MKRLVSLLLALAMAFSLSINVSAEDFTNAEAAAILLNAADFYNPEATIEKILGELNGKEALTVGNAYLMTDRAFGELPEPGNGWLLPAAERPEFTDVSKSLNEAIENLAEARVILDEDGDGLLSPEKAFSEAELQTLILRIYQVYGTNPADSFYAAVNKENFEDLEVLPGMTTAGPLPEAGRLAENQLADLLKKLAEGEFEQGSDEQKAADFYKAFIKLGNKDVNLYYFEKLFRLIDEAEDTAAVHHIYTLMIKQMGFANFLDLGILNNFRGDQKNIYFVGVPKLAVESYEESAYSSNLDDIENYSRELLRLIGDSDPEGNAAAFTAFEKAVYEASLTPEQQGDTSLTYKIKTLEEVQKTAPAWDFSANIKAQGGEPDPEQLVFVHDESRYEEFAKILLPENLEVLKTALKVTVARIYKNYLGDDFRKAYVAFREAVAGVKPLSKEDYYVSEATKEMTLLLQRIYAKYYVDPRVKAGAEEIANGAIATYIKRMDSYTWLDESTREEAKEKLRSLRVLGAYPDDMSSAWDDVDVKSKDAFIIKNEFNKAETANLLKPYGEEHDYDIDIMREMKVYEANAGYFPFFSTLYFPAGILTAPYYDPDAPIEANLGAFGAIVGHEISHAFDNQGATYDSKGVIRNWWTDEDFAEFDSRVKSIITHYDGYEFAPGLMTIASQTVGEDIADIAGLSVILEYLESKKENPDLDLFFRSFAGSWANVRTRQRAVVFAQSDVHSSFWLRVDRVLPLFDEFYEVYDVKEGDGMYVKPENRVAVW
ncbi:MAG: M13 family metallopeptidase [Ruminococcus sp.]|jgi:putative endopeptidase|nr:M13 family metallopeptidase [Ruminococcus sp.]